MILLIFFLLILVIGYMVTIGGTENVWKIKINAIGRNHYGSRVASEIEVRHTWLFRKVTYRHSTEGDFWISQDGRVFKEESHVNNALKRYDDQVKADRALEKVWPKSTTDAD